ncbi:MAG: hypothetical protein IJ711_02170 [Lachnospiraceae bacterium]|nr:hypothetical protein [Lachnospiraceae bacterium]
MKQKAGIGYGDHGRSRKQEPDTETTGEAETRDRIRRPRAKQKSQTGCRNQRRNAANVCRRRKLSREDQYEKKYN